MARRWPVAVAAVLIVAVVAVVGAGTVAALSFDPASQRARIEGAVRRATGRELTLAGPMRISWGLHPVLEAEDVSLANMPGGSRPQMVAVARMEARLDLLPLLSRRVEIASVTLVRPDILLETDANGRGNWQFDRPATQGPAGPPGGGPRLRMQLDSLRVQLGRVTWRNGVTGQVHVAELPNASFDLGAGPAHILAQAQVLGTDVRVEATLGDWAQLTGAAPGPWPVKLAASAGDATVAFDGQADAASRGASGRLEAHVPDLARLGTLLERPGLPPLQDVRFAGTLLPGNGLPQDVALQVGPSDLGMLFPGATLGRLTLSWPAGQAARLEAEGGVYGGPWHVAAGLLPAGQGVAMRAFALSSPFGDAKGDVAVTAAPRPAIRGTLVSGRLDVDMVRSALRAAQLPPATPAPAAVPAASPMVPGPVFSTAPLPWEALRRADADLQLAVETLHWGGVDYRGATGHVSLQDGVGRIEQASMATPGGHVDFSASLDARAAAPPVALNLRSADLSLDGALRAAGLPGGSSGLAELDVVLHAAGQSPHALAATLGGHVGLALVDGEIANDALAATIGTLVKQAGAGLDPGGRSHIRCLALRADADAGVVRLSALKLDTARLEVEGGGTVNLGDETLALHLRPLLRLGGAGVTAPIKVDGTLRRPTVGLDPAAGRTSVTLGGLARPSDSCTPELTAARDGRAGPMPVAITASTKPVKPADLLRSFLR